MTASNGSLKIHPPDPHPEILLDHALTPMEAVNTLYSHGEEELSEAIFASVSRQVFGEAAPEPSGRLRRFLARGVLRLLRRRTRKEYRQGTDGQEMTVYRNSLLERSGHPYAMTLLSPSAANNSTFVEGGDPMNAPYMMICPTISRNAGTWDRLLLDSVQARDVQLRFIWETRSTYDSAKARLDRGNTVRIKAAACGTGLSTILVFDRLIRDGYDPDSITAILTDREEANVQRARILLEKLATTSANLADESEHKGITARTMDLLHDLPSQAISGGHDRYHVVTLVGILEYFRGFTCETTEEHYDEPLLGEESEGEELIRKVGAITADSGVLIANTYRVEPGARILEVFGKKLRYRNREDLHALVRTGGFVPVKTAGSGNVYDTEVFEKESPEG